MTVHDRIIEQKAASAASFLLAAVRDGVGAGVLPEAAAGLCPGCEVDTQRGRVAAGDLAIGDRVLTRDAGYRPVRWVGRTEHSAAQTDAVPDLLPVLIRAGSLGRNLPERDMLVSPHQRMLLRGAIAEALAGEREALGEARAMAGHPGIERAPQRGACYIQILFDTHEILLADGLWTESLQPSPRALQGLGHRARADLVTRFPEFRSGDGFAAYSAARSLLGPDGVRAVLSGRTDLTRAA